MSTSDLELFSTSELIQEIFSRKTFFGILIWANTEDSHNGALPETEQYNMISSVSTEEAQDFLRQGIQVINGINPESGDDIHAE